MKACRICSGETKFSCVRCRSSVCNVCAVQADVNDEGYEETIYCVGICPNRKCPTKESTAKTTVHPFFAAKKRKRKCESTSVLTPPPKKVVTPRDVDSNSIEIQSAEKLRDSATALVMPEEDTAIVKPCQNFESELTGRKQKIFEGLIFDGRVDI